MANGQIKCIKTLKPKKEPVLKINIVNTKEIVIEIKITTTRKHKKQLQFQNNVQQVNKNNTKKDVN